MSQLCVAPKGLFDAEFSNIASDKSISHRCAIFSLLSDKPSTIKNYLRAEDTMNTLKITASLGAKVEIDEDKITIIPPHQIQEPPVVLDCGNSGTAIRLFMGFLSTCEGFFVLSGDQYLNSRPMRRVADPLRDIGSQIEGRANGEFAPLCIRGNTELKAFTYESNISSAQVKTAMILAALRAQGDSTFKEPSLSRDHSENMLSAMGAALHRDHDTIMISPLSKPLAPLDIEVPNDPSSGFFFAVAAAITKGSKVRLKNMLLNPTRIEAYKVLAKMGADVRFITTDSKYEVVGDIVIEGHTLHGVEVSENIAWLIDELPALSIAFSVAKGKSLVKNAKELRVKESDRIATVVENLKKCQIQVKEFDDGYEVVGGALKGTTVDSYGDHRIAMSFAIAGLLSEMTIKDIDCIQTSFPNFIDILSQIANVRVD
ncbi:3-phosphoshikimate 1-carboxyvinyltransferase [Sulfurospirillum sp. 1612]|uniref:3-phosphoshikimate 1-carboxyvinyltransferase n=1 Tax=Sulfurospirillum sp. 1612 TaxID=3094835 RepID=UPI002F955A50